MACWSYSHASCRLVTSCSVVDSAFLPFLLVNILSVRSIKWRLIHHILIFEVAPESYICTLYHTLMHQHLTITLYLHILSIHRSKQNSIKRQKASSLPRSGNIERQVPRRSNRAASPHLNQYHSPYINPLLPVFLLIFLSLLLRILPPKQ